VFILPNPAFGTYRYERYGPTRGVHTLGAHGLAGAALRPIMPTDVLMNVPITYHTPSSTHNRKYNIQPTVHMHHQQ